jgi:hypothetical protein
MQGNAEGPEHIHLELSKAELDDLLETCEAINTAIQPLTESHSERHFF